MKKVLVLLTLVAVTSAYSQGTVAFVNKNSNTTPPIAAPIGYNAGGPMAAGLASSAVSVTSGAYTYGGANAQAGLYGGADVDHLVLLIPAVGFRSGNAAGYVNTGSDTTRTVNGIPAGGTAVVQIRAWDAGVANISTYEAAAALVAANHGVYLGQSAPLTLTLGGVGTPPGPAADLIGLQGFNMNYIVPEPSIIGLGILGTLAGLMVFRRRS